MAINDLVSRVAYVVLRAIPECQVNTFGNVSFHS